MIKLMTVLPREDDATSFYRAVGPLAELRRDYDGMDFSAEDKISWATIRKHDVVFMQRPYTPEHLKVAKMCKQGARPLWIDYDDLLFEVPTDNPSYATYMTKETHTNLAQIIGLADVVTVSTKALKRFLQLPKTCLNQRVYVVENALMDSLVPLGKQYSQKTHVNWRGSQTHARDLASYSQPIIEFARARPDITFTWIGWNPWFITDAMPQEQSIIVPGLPIFDYFEHMCAVSPSVQIVPLDNSRFNQCKSNIAWIEATLAGAVTIAPEWEEWRKPGMITYRNEEDLARCLHFTMDPENSKALKGFHKMSWEYIKENLMLSTVNDKRWRIIDALATLSRCPEEQVEWPAGGEPEEQDTAMELE